MLLNLNTDYADTDADFFLSELRPCAVIYHVGDVTNKFHFGINYTYQITDHSALDHQKSIIPSIIL